MTTRCSPARRRQRRVSPGALRPPSPTLCAPPLLQHAHRIVDADILHHVENASKYGLCVAPTIDSTRDPGRITIVARMLVVACLALALAVSCNAPFEAVVSSQRGGLAFEGEPASGFAALVPYAMTFDLPVAGGGLACDSAAMRAAPGQDTSACRRRIEPGGTGVASGAAMLRLTTRPGGPPLLMGRYSDTITVRLAPRLGG